MTLNFIKQMLEQGEGLHCEFKKAGNSLPSNLFETICAFFNTDGGYVFLGVDDGGNILGVAQAAVQQLKNNLINLSNNSQKLDPGYLLSPEEFEIEGKTIIVIQVPVSSQLHKTAGEVYLRREDGDYRVRGTHQLAGMINRKLGRFDRLGSGVININKYLPLYAHGAKPIFQETNNGFELVLPLENAESRPESRPESKLAIDILKQLKDGSQSKSELANLLGHKSISGELNKQVKKLSSEQLIEMTIPDKPNSRLQKYRLTKKGIEFLQKNKKS